MQVAEGVLMMARLSQGTTISRVPVLSLSHQWLLYSEYGDLVNMKDFLSDNMTLMQQFEAFGVQTSAPTSPTGSKPWLRDNHHPGLELAHPLS